ncbi:hypothetical protein J4402_05045 [Candidatus Pacearchaeota archaeon]|nr:hypothetical protein [Candidatus Pacearchaeota archaeon]
MGQNRNKLIELFISNVSNVVIHRILEKAVFGLNKNELGEKYRKELVNSFEIARRYREKINPVGNILPDKFYVRDKVIRKVRAELGLRISRGYEGIDLDLVDGEVELVLGEMGVI